MRDQKLTSRGLCSTLRKEMLTLRGWGITLEEGMAREQENEELKDRYNPSQARSEKHYYSGRVQLDAKKSGYSLLKALTPSL